jgi:hypothetical protein
MSGPPNDKREDSLPPNDTSFNPMPELPDIVVYIEALESRIVGLPLERVRLSSPFVLRSVDPPIEEAYGAENETNYCARCQTGGKLLADRALSRLLRKDWPRTLDELEAARADTA